MVSAVLYSSMKQPSSMRQKLTCTEKRTQTVSGGEFNWGGSSQRVTEGYIKVS